jgi:hypothetical protein
LVALSNNALMIAMRSADREDRRLCEGSLPINQLLT